MKRPSFQFYSGDWLSDPALGQCSLATRGAWITMIALMHENGESGQLDGTVESLTRVVGCTTSEMEAVIDELARTKTATVTRRHASVRVCNRRMRRAWSERESAKNRAKTYRERKLVTPHHAKVTSYSSSSSSSSVFDDDEEKRLCDVCVRVGITGVCPRHPDGSPPTPHEIIAHRIAVQPTAKNPPGVVVRNIRAGAPPPVPSLAAVVAAISKGWIRMIIVGDKAITVINKEFKHNINGLYANGEYIVSVDQLEQMKLA